MNIKIRRTTEQSKMPIRGSSEAAGFDLYATESGIVTRGVVTKFRTGIAIELPHGYYAEVKPRSGLAARYGIDVLAGVIDSDYRGEIVVLLTSLASTHTVQPGERIAQLVIQRYAHDVTLVEVDELSNTVRGSGGFGSSGQ